MNKFETGYIDYKDSAMGKMEKSMKAQSEKRVDELQKLREDFEKYRAEQAAYSAATEKRHELAERRQFWRGALAGAIGSTIANFIIYYWPSILEHFHIITSFLLRRQ